MNKKAKSVDPEYFDTAYADYSGKKRFLVSHPDEKRKITVAAPTFDSAIVAAAKFWDRPWTEYRFYAFCTVSQIGGGDDLLTIQ